MAVRDDMGGPKLLFTVYTLTLLLLGLLALIAVYLL